MTGSAPTPMTKSVTSATFAVRQPSPIGSNSYDALWSLIDPLYAVGFSCRLLSNYATPVRFFQAVLYRSVHGQLVIIQLRMTMKIFAVSVIFADTRIGCMFHGNILLSDFRVNSSRKVTSLAGPELTFYPVTS